MTPAAIAELVLLSTTLLEKLIPALASIKPGEVPVEQQEAIHERIAALRLKLESGQLGSHWQVPDRD